jgi:CheY-like chemotaxis protein
MILCIDDEPNGLRIRKMLLQTQGYEVMTALSGPEGLELLDVYPFTAVIVDYSMPVMNGGEVAAEITTVNLCLASNFPILLAWGSEFTQPSKQR